MKENRKTDETIFQRDQNFNLLILIIAEGNLNSPFFNLIMNHAEIDYNIQD